MMDEIGRFQVDVEKLLCVALGREWEPSGFSIASLCADVRTLRRTLEQSWQPIETAPTDGTPVLVYVPDLRFEGMYSDIPPVVAAFSNGRDWICQLREEGIDYAFDGDEEYAMTTIEPVSIHPTHWIPMPAPPQAQIPGLAIGAGETVTITRTVTHD